MKYSGNVTTYNAVGDVLAKCKSRDNPIWPPCGYITPHGKCKLITLGFWLDKAGDDMLDGILSQAGIRNYASTDDMGSEAELHVSTENEILLYISLNHGGEYLWTRKDLQNGISLHFDGQDAVMMKIVRCSGF